MVMLSALATIGPIESFPLVDYQQRIDDCPIAMVAVFLFDILLVLQLTYAGSCLCSDRSNLAYSSNFGDL